MRPDLKPKIKGPPPVRADSSAAIQRDTEVSEVKRQHSRIRWYQDLTFGLLAIGAIYVYFEWFAPVSQAPASTTVAQQPQPAKAQKPRPATPATPAKPAAKETPPPPPQAAATPAAEEPAVVKLTEADRLAAETPMLMVGLDSRRDAAIHRDEELLKRTIEGKAWDAYRGLLGKSLKAALPKLEQGRGSNRFDPLWKEPVFYQAMLRWKTLGCFSQSDINPLVIGSYTADMFLWLLHNNDAMEELLVTLDSKDDSGKVLKFLIDAWPINEKKYAKYFSLALACAVVFDKPMNIPHPVGQEKYGVENTVEPLKRYMWYVEKDEKGRLAAPVHRSSARDLIWVVCAPVTTSELEWSIDHMQMHRNKWGTTYGMIKYLMKKAVDPTFNPYKEYSFAEILKKGGICGDQSYFCVNTARAQGIPAMTIAGETNLGGHAWAGVKIDDQQWVTTIGRIGGASKGEAGNPQTGTSISEQEIQLWNDRYHRSPVVSLTVSRHLWLADFFAATDSPGDNAASVHLANSLGRTFVESWRALYKLLERQTKLAGQPAVPSNLDEWKSFAKDMRREFKNNPRIAQLADNAETEHIFPYGTEGDAKRTFLRERRRVERDAGEQKDIIASSLKREADVILKMGGPDARRDIKNLYDRALRDYGGSITGFKMMADDYFGYFKDEPETARKAAREIELAFERVVKTGSTDFFRATTEASVCKMICEFYRIADEPDRATLLEKRYEVLLRRAKRNAL